MFVPKLPSPSLYLLPIGETEKNILNDLYEKIASLQASTKANKLSMLLPPFVVRSRKYYNSSPQVLLLSHCVTELLDLRFYNNLSRVDVTLTSSDVDEAGSAMRTLLKVFSGLTGGL